MAKYSLFLIIFSAFLISVIVANDLQIGNLTNAQLTYVENVKLSGIPLRTRTKNVFYNDENIAPKVIKAISAVDLGNSEAKVTVTAGGVGSTFANVRLRSKRGESLDFQVQIFV